MNGLDKRFKTNRVMLKSQICQWPIFNVFKPPAVLKIQYFHPRPPSITNKWSVYHWQYIVASTPIINDLYIITGEILRPVGH